MSPFKYSDSLPEPISLEKLWNALKVLLQFNYAHLERTSF